MGRKFRNLDDLANSVKPNRQKPKLKKAPPDYEQRKKIERERALRDKRRKG